MGIMKFFLLNLLLYFFVCSSSAQNLWNDSVDHTKMYFLDQQWGFYIHTNGYYENVSATGKRLYSKKLDRVNGANNVYDAIAMVQTTGEIYEYDGTQPNNLGKLLMSVDPDVYADPKWLIHVPAPKGVRDGNSVEVDTSGLSLSVDTDLLEEQIFGLTGVLIAVVGILALSDIFKVQQ